MPAPKHTRQVVFSAAERSPSTTYSLLSLPAALLRVLESDSAPHLEIRGSETDAAVLVTDTTTYALRGVQNSNSLCLCSSGKRSSDGRSWFAPEGRNADDDDEEEIGSQGPIKVETVLHETLEVVKVVPRTERLDELLKGTDYTGEDGEARPKAKRKRVTMASLQSEIPASDLEITRALEKNRVVRLGQELRRIPTSYLLLILPAILRTLPTSAVGAYGGESMDVDSLDPTTPVKPVHVSRKDKLKKGKGKAGATVPESEVKPVIVEVEEDDLLMALDALDCREEAAKGILSWFGDVTEPGKMAVRVVDVVKELGIATLESEGYAAQRLDAFIDRWKQSSPAFSNLCVLQILAGQHVLNPSFPPTITFVPPSRLSPDPATRFAELFSIKPKWRDTEMALFLDDLVGGDTKKRDALVLKFVRKVKDPSDGGATLWTARNLW